jgi:tRNA(Ile)-lysidine synthase
MSAHSSSDSHRRLPSACKQNNMNGVSEFLQRVAQAIHRRGLIARGRKLIVAVSGGADSMVLLHALHLLATQNRWQIIIAHFNHQLRGRASDGDEKLVRQTAAKLKLPFYVDCADVKSFAASAKLSVEMAARQCRHEFFARVARQSRANTIALAHHADDQVELFFLRLLRGAGGEGLAGMKWRSPSPVTNLNSGRAKLRLCPFVDGAEKRKNSMIFSKAEAERQLRPTTLEIVRPLLGFSKAEILAFARGNKIRFRDDATNFSDDFLRNRIRNELLPLLKEKYQPGLAKTVLRLLDIVGAESEVVGEAARQWSATFGWRRGDESQIKNAGKTKNQMEIPYVVSDKDFEPLSVAVQRRVLQKQLIECGIVADFGLVEQLRGAVETFVSVSPDLSVKRDRAGKIFLRRRTAIEHFNADELELSGRAGRATFGGKDFKWTIKKYGGARARSPRQATEFFDADQIGGEILLRHWRAGDRFQPIGLSSAVKLQDLFVNAKIPAAKRRGLVLATTAAGEIFWVEGLRIGERFKLTSQTHRQLVWEWSNLTA